MDVEIWSDINCPWCYIGKRRFEAAMSRFEHAAEVDLTWRSFELDPAAPAEIPGNAAAMLAEKYGVPLERARAMEQNVSEVAAADGLEYDLEHARIGSSFDGHRLVHLARRHGLQDAMKERLFRARFGEGRLVSDLETLVLLASEVGLDGAAVRATLAGDEFAREVRDDEATARELGISGVPMFVVDRAFGMSGAQPAEQLLALLEHAWEAGDGVDQPRADSA
ncbi:MAG TPA: DsbA family oxidoreductase [Solirubrobacteraceae bacterium]|jgi:predicted DsbA family dithiol-disulfide isomerase|nr:DsbA family oxidoreductase [Solirubrobacteraceae bacterium]